MAETTERPIYFFRFEDVMANPRKEISKLFQFVLGMDTLEGTVLETRIEEILSMGSEKNRVYKPRSGGSNKNLKNFTREQIAYCKEVNEELFHVFGYAKDEREENNTPFLDFEGKARPESTQKTNYYKKLNEMGFERRKKQLRGELDKDLMNMGEDSPGYIRMISSLNIMANQAINLEHLRFAN